MKIAVCFLTQHQDNFNWSKLIDQANTSKLHQVDIYGYINRDGECYSNNGVITIFDFDDLRKKFNWPYVYDNMWSGLRTKESTMHLAWLDMYSNHKGEYDMYLFMEDDFGYFGKENFFDSIDFDCDALFVNERVLMTYFDWVWFTAESYLDENVIKDHYHGLVNLFGYKGYLIDELIEFIKEGNFAHFEWILSSFPMNKDIKIHYVSHYMRVWDSFVPNDIPNLPFYDLIHPIKTVEQYQIYCNRLFEKSKNET